MKRSILLIICACALCAGIAALALTAALSAKPGGHISFTVADAYTLKPIPGAYIVLPESGAACMSDARGRANVYSVPLDMKAGFTRLAGAEYAELTAIVYAEGYIPCVWFKLHAYPDRVTHAPALYLFPEGSESVPVTVFSQSPDVTLMKEFVAKYAPSR